MRLYNVMQVPYLPWLAESHRGRDVVVIDQRYVAPRLMKWYLITCTVSLDCLLSVFVSTCDEWPHVAGWADLQHSARR